MRAARRLLPFPLAVLAACGGGPTAPELQVSGEWVETNTVTVNTCGVELPPTLETRLTWTRTGERIASTAQGIRLEGTIDPRTGEFVVEGTFPAGGITQTVRQEGRFTGDDAYTATSVITTRYADGSSCEFRTADEGHRAPETGPAPGS